jgi:hypothetical protein
VIPVTAFAAHKPLSPLVPFVFAQETPDSAEHNIVSDIELINIG